MKKIMPLVIFVTAIIYFAGACTKLKSPVAPPTETPTPNSATATVIAQVTQTAVALQTAGLSAQQTATEQAAIILSQTPTFTVTRFVTPTSTATVQHGFRLSTCSMYADGDLKFTYNFSYGSGATPTAC